MIDLPRELIQATEEHAAELARLRARDNWTGLEEVKLGKAYKGQLIVDVESAYDDPNVSRRYINEVYYTTLDGTQVGRCIDNQSDHRAGRVVTIGYPPGKPVKEVYKVSSVAPVDPSSNELGVNPHRNQHELVNYGYRLGDYTGKVGNDIPRVDDRQMWNINVQPWDGMTIRIPQGWMCFGGLWQWWEGGTSDLSAYVPVIPAMGRNVVIGLSRALGITVAAGPLFAYHYNPLTDYLPTLDPNYYPIAVVLLEYGMARITWANIRPGLNVHAVADDATVYGDIGLMLDDLEDAVALAYPTHSVLDISTPPLAAELTAEFGDPATVGKRFVGFVDDGGADSAVYAIYSNGTSWWHAAMTKAL